MLKLKCPSCGFADIDATRETYCSRCGRRLVGSLDTPYGWEPLGGARGRAAATAEVEPATLEARAPEGLPGSAAGFWLRAIAWGIDLVAVAFGAFVLANALRSLDTFGYVFWIVAFSYFTVCNRLGGSVGKAVMGLRVISLDQRPIGWLRAILRSIFWLIGLMLMGLGLFWIGGDRQKQGWHDKVSGTLVVKLHRAWIGWQRRHTKGLASLVAKAKGHRRAS